MQYFERWEFACRCGCGFDSMDYETAEGLDYIRGYANRPVIVTSGCRCPTHNKKEGGSSQSQHMFARATDFTIRNYDLLQLYKFLSEEFKGTYGLKYYKDFNIIHFDTRKKEYREVG